MCSSKREITVETLPFFDALLGCSVSLPMEKVGKKRSLRNTDPSFWQKLSNIMHDSSFSVSLPIRKPGIIALVELGGFGIQGMAFSSPI